MKKIIFLLFFGLITQIQAQWTQLGQTVFGLNTNAQAGHKVRISKDGSTFAVGELNYDNSYVGAVKIYNINTNSLTQIGNDLTGVVNNEGFSYGMDINSDGSIIAIGGPNYQDPNNPTAPSLIGEVKVFKNVGGNWTQLGTTLYGNDEYELFGTSISLSDDGFTMAVSSYGYDADPPNFHFNTGKVSVFHYDGSTWSQIGNSIIGEHTNEFLGWSVSLNATGDILVIGAPKFKNSSNQVLGKVQFYKLVNNNWQFHGEFLGDNDNDLFGRSVSLNDSGDKCVVGADGNNTGYFKAFELVSGTWGFTQKVLGQSGESMGYSISLNAAGDALIVGAYAYQNNLGKAKIYEWQNNAWQYNNVNFVGDANDDYFGYSVSMNGDGDMVGIGAFRGDTNGNDSGYAKVYSNPSLQINSLEEIGIKLFPNPANNFIQIQNLMNKNIIFKIYSIEGKLIKEKHINDNINNLIDISELNRNVYFCNFLINNKSITVKLIVK